MEPELFWNIVSSISTFTAVVIALYLAVRDILEKRTAEPRILLEFTDDLKQLHDNSANVFLRIKNVGKTTVLYPKVRIIEVTQDGKTVVHAGERLQSFNEERLQSGDYQNFTLLNVYYSEKQLRIYSYTNNQGQKGFNGKKIDKKTSIFKLLVVGDNLKAFEKTVEYVEAEQPHNFDIIFK